HEHARRIDLKIFPFYEKRFAVSADTVAAPFTSYPDIHGGLSDMVEAILSPPLGKLSGIADRLEDTSRRRGDEDFCDDGILIGRDDGSSHIPSLRWSLANCFVPQISSSSQRPAAIHRCNP